VLVLILTVALLAALSAGAQQKGPIAVGSKLDSEGQILGHMIIALLEANGFATVNRVATGTTFVTREALVNGEIDIYPEYTGTAINQFFQGQNIPAGASQNADQSYEIVKRLDRELNGVHWLGRAPANNTFAIAIPRPLADRERITSLVDFAAYVNRGGAVRLVASQEFVERDDGLKSFERTYGFELRPDQIIILAGATPDTTQSAVARGTGGANVAMAYGTDGTLAALNLVALTDPRGAQPVYQPVPIVRGAVIGRYPEITTLFDAVFATLDLPTLQSLNAKVGVEGQNPQAVAREYLRAGGFIR
jgi:osmoprotectant transport system substrate-binding protein